MQRCKLLPKKCSRCGNDFMTGKAVIFLPYEKRYVGLCSVCCKGLDLPEGLIQRPAIKSEEQDIKRWDKFWKEEIK